MQDVHVQKVIERCFCLKLMNKSCGESDLGFFGWATSWRHYIDYSSAYSKTKKMAL